MSAHPDRRRLEQAGELSGDERRAVLEHVHGCAACRAVMLRADPTAVFRLLAVQPLPEALLERVSAGVSAEIDEALDRGRSRRGAAWGWVAAAAVVAALLSWPLWSPAPVPEAPVADVLPSAAGERAIVELLEAPETAQVIDLDLDGVQLVMIFDEEIDL